MELQQDWKEFLSSLSSNNVKYLVVGAHALAVYGRPRYTGDLDVWVQPSASNAKRVIAALKAFGFAGLKGLQQTDFSRPDLVITLGNPPVRIDLLTGLSGLSFPAAWKNRVKADVGGERVFVLSLNDYRRNKKAAGRPKDLLDLALLDEEN